MTTVNDVHSQLGKWKEIIIIDLYNAFFQNHLSKDDQQWLGIMTPFSRLRVLTRSGQGLLGQSEELDEIMAKILGDDIKEGSFQYHYHCQPLFTRELCKRRRRIQYSQILLLML